MSRSKSPVFQVGTNCLPVIGLVASWMPASCQCSLDHFGDLDFFRIPVGNDDGEAQALAIRAQAIAFTVAFLESELVQYPRRFIGVELEMLLEQVLAMEWGALHQAGIGNLGQALIQNGVDLLAVDR